MEEILIDFESGDLSKWSVQDSNFQIYNNTNNYDGQYSVGIETGNANKIIASITPSKLERGEKIEAFEYYYKEDSSSTGGGFVLIDRDGNDVCGFATDNPEYNLYDNNGHKQIGDPSNYHEWMHVKFVFNWDAGTFDYTITRENGNQNTGTGNLINTTNVKTLEFRNYNSEAWESGECYTWIDNIKVTGSFCQSYYLVHENDKFKTYSKELQKWIDLGTSVDINNFIEDGMKKLSSEIPIEDLSTNNPEILVWNNNPNKILQANINAVPKEQLILANEDINIKNVRFINSLTLDTNQLTIGPFFETDLGSLDGDTRNNSNTFDCSNKSNVKITFDMGSSSMDNEGENGHLLWWTGDEWKIVKELHNESGSYEVLIPDEWLSSQNKLQLDLVSGDGSIHAEGNGGGDDAYCRNVKLYQTVDNIRTIVSTDNGQTWKSYIDGNWNQIEATIANVKADGMPVTDFNRIPKQSWDDLISNSDTLRFGYYIKLNNIDDTQRIGSLYLDADMNGTWKRAIHQTDYHTKYTFNNLVVIDFLADGDYKINYQR